MASVIVSVLTELSNYRKGMAEVQRTAGETAGKFSSLGKYVGGALLTGAVVKFGRDSVRAFDEAQHAAAGLQNSLANNPATVGVSVKAFEDLNKSLAKHVLANADVIASGEGVLAEFGLTEAQLKSMAPVLVDTAAKMGTDIPTAADAIGKALLGNSRGLKSIGIEFKATGDRTADLARLQDLLAQKTRGAGQAQKDAAGPGQLFQKSLHELEITVGGALVPALAKVTTVISGLFDWFTNLPTPAKKAIETFASLAAGIWLIVKAEGAWKAITTALAESSGLLDLALGPVGIGLGILTAAYIAFHHPAEAAAKATTDFTEALKLQGQAQDDAVVKQIATALATNDTHNAISGLDQDLRTMTGIPSDLAASGFGIADAAKAVAGGSKGVEDFISHLHDVANNQVGVAASADLMNKDIDALAPILRQLGGDLDGQRTKADALGVAQKALGGGMLSAADAALTEAERVDKLSGALSGVVDAQATYDQSLRNVDAAGVALTDSQTALNKLTKDGAKDQQAISDATDQYQSALRGVRDATDRQTEAQKALSDAQKPATVLEMASATDKLQAAQDSLTDSQKSLADATAQYEKILTAFQTGKKLDPATFDELAIAQDDARQAYIAWQTALGTGKSVGDVARAHKAYTDSVAKLQTLQKQGTVTEADVQTAKEKVDTATVTLDGSTQSLADSQTALTAAQQKGSDLDPAVVAARKNLRDATEGLDSAQKNATQSQKTMSTAMKGDPAWAENVRKARADVADKTAALHKAQTDAAKSAAELETKTAAERTTFHDLGGEIANVGAQLDQLGAAHPEIASFLTPLYAELGKALENLPKGSVIGFTPLPPGISGPGTPILKAASGAIVMPRPGGTLVNVAEAGQAEGIFPLPAGMSGVGGGTTTINYVTVEGSVWSLNDLTDALHEGLLRKQRRSGSLGLS